MSPIPAPVTDYCAMRSLVVLKLFGGARHGHLMSQVFDEGLGLFAGLNVIPKRAFLTEYSCRIDPRSFPKLMNSWFDAASKLGLERGVSFDVDFHTIPCLGDDALLEKHYVSKRSRRQKGMLAFLAQDVLLEFGILSAERRGQGTGAKTFSCRVRSILGYELPICND